MELSDNRTVPRKQNQNHRVALLTISELELYFHGYHAKYSLWCDDFMSCKINPPPNISTF